MLVFQEIFIRLPCSFVQPAFLRPREEIASLQRKRATLPAFDSSPHGVFPICCVQRHFPDVVPARSRTPRGLLCGHSLEGLFEIRSLPVLFLVGFIEQREHELYGIHAASSAEPVIGKLVKSITHPTHLPPTNLHEYQKKEVTKFVFRKQMNRKELDEGKQRGYRGQKLEGRAPLPPYVFAKD